MVKYIATTNLNELIELCKSAEGGKTHPVIMIDGTVPGWERDYWDHHFDHHRPGGGRVQIDELPELDECSFLVRESNTVMQDRNADTYNISSEYVICTTLVDADAAVAAAYLQLTSDVDAESLRKLRAIALDCDYLCLPPGEEDLSDLAGFAARAVAGLKESSKDLWKELGCPGPEKVQWTSDQRCALS